MIADNLGGVDHGGQSALKPFGLTRQTHEELEVFVSNEPEQATLRSESANLTASYRLGSARPRHSELLE